MLGLDESLTLIAANSTGIPFQSVQAVVTAAHCHQETTCLPTCAYPHDLVRHLFLAASPKTSFLFQVPLICDLHLQNPFLQSRP